MKHRNLLVAILLFLFISLGFYLLLKKHNAQKVHWHEIGQPLYKDLDQYINAAGRLQAQDEITIGSLVAGRIVKLLVDDNASVKPGQILVELDDGIGYSAVKKGKAALIESKANARYIEEFYKRQKAIFKAGQLSKDTFENYTKQHVSAQAQVLQTEADLEIRKQEYNNLFIKAPDKGIIIDKKVNLGQMITSRLQATELFKIAKDLTKMEAEIDVDEADIGLVKAGQDASFTVDAFPQKPFNSKVKQVYYRYKVVDNVITYAVILDIDNPNLTLRPGMTTNVDIKVNSVKHALCIPNKALRINRKALNSIAQKKGYTVEEIPQTIRTKSKESIWTITNGTLFKEIPVKLGVADNKYTQIIEGIDQNTKIVIEALDPKRGNPIVTMGMQV